jgi:hypothetical protein
MIQGVHKAIQGAGAPLPLPGGGKFLALGEICDSLESLPAGG